MPMEPWLDVGDPLAEAVVIGLRARRIPLANPLPAIRRLAAAGDADCRAFLHDLETPSDWADFASMRLGAGMIYRNFAQFLVAMLYGGLMTTFCSADAAYILTRTGRLERNVGRRIFESGSLFFGVLDVDALQPGGRVWETCVHVRLMHTMVRLHLIDTGAWPLRGKPISAGQTAAGPLFFGAMILDRLSMLGAYVTAAEADGYYLIWRHVTRLLGVPAELVGSTAEEQAVLDERILPYSFNPDDNSRRLAGILLSGLNKLPGAEHAPRAVHEVLARYMLGHERADGMAIPRHPVGTGAMRVVATALEPYAWIQRIPAVRQRLEAFGREYLNRTMERGLAGKPADFQPLNS
ncbi:oxygenase MpaB family protein [Nocardia sp. NPDC003482]